MSAGKIAGYPSVNGSLQADSNIQVRAYIWNSNEQQHYTNTVSKFKNNYYTINLQHNKAASSLLCKQTAVVNPCTGTMDQQR